MMRKRILVILMAIGPLFLFAQENSEAVTPTTETEAKTKIKEIGLLFPDLSNLGNIGLTYRFGTNKAVWRINSLFLTSNSSTNITQLGNPFTEDLHTFTTGVQFGRECRKVLGENFELRLGADVSFKYRRDKKTNTSSTNVVPPPNKKTNAYTPGANLVLGFNYIIKKQLIIGVEFLPGINYTTEKNETENNNNGNITKTTSHQLQYGFNNYSGLLSLSYRF